MKIIASLALVSLLGVGCLMRPTRTAVVLPVPLQKESHDRGDCVSRMVLTSPERRDEAQREGFVVGAPSGTDGYAMQETCQNRGGQHFQLLAGDERVKERKWMAALQEADGTWKTIEFVQNNFPLESVCSIKNILGPDTSGPSDANSATADYLLVQCSVADGLGRVDRVFGADFTRNQILLLYSCTTGAGDVIDSRSGRIVDMLSETRCDVTRQQ